jgi:hypothetical protein
VAVNNTIVGNHAFKEGGAVFCETLSSVILFNSILWDNEAPAAPEIMVSTDYLGQNSSLFIRCSDVKGGLASTVVGTGSTLDWGTSGMIDADPLFADAGSRDFHLTFTSPCRNAGDLAAPDLPAEDFEGDPRVAGGAADMGADEFHRHLYFTGTPSPGYSIVVKIVGLPGEAVNGLILGVKLLDAPLPCDYGLWYLDNPVLIVTGLGLIPAGGIAPFPGTLPASPPVPYTVYLQGAVDMELTNLCALEVE